MEKNKSKKPFNYIKMQRRVGLVIYDVLSILAASFLAILFRFEFHFDQIPMYFIEPIERFLPISIALRAVVEFLMMREAIYQITS